MGWETVIPVRKNLGSTIKTWSSSFDPAGYSIAMYRNFQQEAFSRAYIHAVAAAAGFKYSDGPLPDDDHVDVTISATGPMGLIRSPKVDIQAKCRLGIPPDGDPISYALDKDDYEGLRHTDYGSPRILVVVFVPNEVAQWTEHSEEKLILSYCG